LKELYNSAKVYPAFFSKLGLAESMTSKIMKPLKLIYSGKTKDVFSTENPEFLIFQFKDTILGHPNGTLDRGGHYKVGELKGKGKAVVESIDIFARLLSSKGILTHFVRKIDDHHILFRKTDRIPLEVICRNQAWGSFLRRYKNYVQKGHPLYGLVELTLKDDELDDPLITDDSVVSLGIAEAQEIQAIRRITKEVNQILLEYFCKLNLVLIDFKVEYGRLDDALVLIDDIVSVDTMRVLDPARDKILDHFELLERMKAGEA
jgi:phosphoribosylaminoimidazole-succinocarboxamide synthase